MMDKVLLVLKRYEEFLNFSSKDNFVIITSKVNNSNKNGKNFKLLSILVWTFWIKHQYENWKDNENKKHFIF